MAGTKNTVGKELNESCLHKTLNTVGVADSKEMNRKINYSCDRCYEGEV